MKPLRMFSRRICDTGCVVKTFHNAFIFQQAVTIVKITENFGKSHQRLLHTKK